MKIIMSDDQLQELTTGTCGIFQLYFYKHLFDPDSDSKILNDEFLKTTATTTTTTKNSNNIA